MVRSFKPKSRPGLKGPGQARCDEEVDDILRKLKSDQISREVGYRERSLKLHGWICAKCGREFEQDSLHLLTVHHKDGNHNNNPPDGRNWENLCIYCHDDEHSRTLLGDYLSGKKR